jgi:peptidoglycan hydrolase CwlO-like protein
LHFAEQISRLTRDLESLEEQRDRAREEGKRSEQQRIQLEAEIKVGHLSINSFHTVGSVAVRPA